MNCDQTGVTVNRAEHHIRHGGAKVVGAPPRVIVYFSWVRSLLSNCGGVSARERNEG